MRTMMRENVKAFGYAFLVTAVLVALIVIGSRQLTHFDAALVAYTFAALFAVFGLTYRYAIWLQRPPPLVYWKRGWQVFLQRGHHGRNASIWVRRVTGEFAANSFIFKRDKFRWLAHMGIMWGSLMGAAITLPLVFGWTSFESIPGTIGIYRVLIFGFPTVTMPYDSFPAFMMFHGLVWASFLTMGGVMLAMRRRMRDQGAAAAQIFSEDFLPLLMALLTTGESARSYAKDHLSKGIAGHRETYLWNSEWRVPQLAVIKAQDGADEKRVCAVPTLEQA